MDAISLWQPWAEWIAHGLKLTETRTHARFKCLEGKRIAIHASRKFDRDAWDAAKPFLKAAGNESYGWFVLKTSEFHLGVIICTALVEKVQWLDGCHSQGALIDCGGVRRFGLYLTGVNVLQEPIPSIGRQGIFEVEI
jgi:hypothetical protein